MSAQVHPIETESYRRMADRIDLAGWAPGPAAVARRVVHATADPSLVDALVCSEEAVRYGVAALGGGAPVLCDVEMVRAGISVPRARCGLRDAGPTGADGRVDGHPSRSAAGMARLLDEHPDGAVVVVGCAPTALDLVVRRLADRTARPAIVVGVPVGFVGAATAKAALVEVATGVGVPVIVLTGERGGAAVAAAVVNALARLATTAPLGAAGPPTAPACLVIGHGTRSSAGAEELRRFADAMARERPSVATAPGFIEFMEPGLDAALDSLVDTGARRVVAVPLVLLGAGHMKDDGPAALDRARRRHRRVTFSYGRDLGVHPDVLAVVADRIGEAAARLEPGATALPDAVVVVGRGSSDPDANADLAKAARLLADGRSLAAPLPGDGGSAPDAPPLALVVPAFVSLARPGVAAALDHCAALGARRIVVVPYFLFDGLLIDRIREQVAAWTATHPGCRTVTGHQMGVDPRLVALAWHRYDEAVGGPVHMNCDGCLHRAPLPGYEARVGAPR